MPRRDAYLTDDDDDDTPRRAAASGGGVPGWVWGTGGAVVFVVLLVGSFAVAFFNKRAALQQEHVARAELARAEAMRKADVHAEKKAVAGRSVVPLAKFTKAYKDDPENANVHYSGRPFRVQVRVTSVGEKWVGTSADLGAGPPRGTVPNVIFNFAAGHAGRHVVPGQMVVIEGLCAGLLPGPDEGPMRGPTLIFAGCRVEE